MSTAENLIKETFHGATEENAEAVAAEAESGDSDPTDPTETPALREQHKQHSIVQGQFIAARREEAGLTQAELARELGVSQQSVFAYERGERRVSVMMLKRMADVLCIPFAQLAFMKAPKRPPRIPAGVVLLAKQILELRPSDRRSIKRIVVSLRDPITAALPLVQEEQPVKSAAPAPAESAAPALSGRSIWDGTASRERRWLRPPSRPRSWKRSR